MEEKIIVTGIGAPITENCTLYVFHYSLPTMPGIAYVFENCRGETIINSHCPDKITSRLVNDLYTYLNDCKEVDLKFEVPAIWGKEHSDLIPEKLKKEVELNLRDELIYRRALDTSGNGISIIYKSLF